MEPLSNEEDHLRPPALDTQALNNLHLPDDDNGNDNINDNDNNNDNDNSFPFPSTPPPTYGEAVQPDPFPVLTPPRVPAAVTSASQNTLTSIHPPTQRWIQPPSYEEASLHPTASDAQTFNSIPALSDNASFLLCPTPPPTYGDAVGETQIAGSVQTQPEPVSQSQSVPIALSSLRDVPAVVRCPYCGHVGATKITYMPGRLAWCICILVVLIGGFFFGFCLIPLMARSLQDVHHACAQCGQQLHTYAR